MSFAELDERLKKASQILEYNSLCREHRYDMNELFALLVDYDPKDDLKISPSTYLYQMKLPTNERLEILINTFKKVTMVHGMDVSQPVSFRIFPRIIVFQNFDPGTSYTAYLTITNVSKVLRMLSMKYETNGYLSVNWITGKKKSVASGMSFRLKVIFTPESKNDNTFLITFVSGGEVFYVPVIAFGPRPCLQLPDQIIFPSTAVKIPISKTIPVKNIGEVDCTFSMVTNRPFQVDHKGGFLKHSESTIITVSFEPQFCGEFKGTLILKYETGEEVSISLIGKSENVNIFMETESVEFPDTFMQLKRSYSLKIFNNSDFICQFKWKKLPNDIAEKVELERLEKAYQRLKQFEVRKSADLEVLNVIDHHGHQVVYDRIYEDDLKALKQEEFFFTHQNFMISPLAGEIWPNNCITVNLIFEPDKEGEFSVEAFCEVSGREDRLQIKMAGKGKGPKISINLSILDIHYICLCATHYYQVVVNNTGDIPGTVCYVDAQLVFGGNVECCPDILYLLPGESKSFVLSFTSKFPGSFTERISFIIDESKSELFFTMKGNIISPTLHFSKTRLDLNNVPIGFPVSSNVALHNLSLVPVNYALRVTNDGQEKSLTYKDFSRLERKSSLSHYPKEYNIEPINGCVQPNDYVDVKITVLANVVREKKCHLLVDLWDASFESLSLPIYCNAYIPVIEVYPEEITIQFCFINFPYNRTITLRNLSDVSAYYCIVPQQVTQGTNIFYSASVPQGVLKPRAEDQISFCIMTNALGRQDVQILMWVMGDDEPRKFCHIICNGQGPVISVIPQQIYWGEVTLLQLYTQELKITNDAPITASFEALLVRPKSSCSIQPSRGILSSEESVTLTITLYLVDTGRYTDSIEIKVTNSRTITVNMKALGTGTSLVIEPSIENIDLGPLFSNKIIWKELTIENKGRKQHQLTWFSNTTRSRLDCNDSAVFSIQPKKFDLGPKEKTTMAIECYYDGVGKITEDFHCSAIINGGVKNSSLLTSRITATFLEPLLKFSKLQVDFQINIGPEDEFEVLHDTLSIANKTVLAVHIDLEIQYPFIINETKLSMCINPLSSEEITVSFDPTFITNKYSVVIEKQLKLICRDNPHTDMLLLRAEVNFPNIKLQRKIIDFGCILVGSDASQEFFISNTSPLPLRYHWHWYGEIQATSYDETSVISASSHETFETEEENNEETIFHYDNIKKYLKVYSQVRYEQQLEEEIEIITEELEMIQSDNNIDETHDAEEQIIEKTESTEYSSDKLKSKLFYLFKYFMPRDEPEEESYLETLPEKAVNLNPTNEVFDIIPHFGVIEPNGIEGVCVTFSGFRRISAFVSAVCLIDGGPSETIEIFGVADNINYEISSTNIDFGSELFCRTKERYVVLSNSGKLAFDFRIDSLKSEIYSDSETSELSNQGFYNVTPRTGNLKSQTEIKICIVHCPGIPGPFKKSFKLQIGHLMPIKILIYGVGSYPQIHVLLPRYKALYVQPEVALKAISKLCYTWKSPFEIQEEFGYEVFEMNKQDLDYLYRNDWLIISKMDNFPPVIDIDLAVEIEMISCKIKESSCKACDVPNRRCRHIPKLKIMPYILDFGCIIIGTKATCSINLCNIGTVHATVKVILPDSERIKFTSTVEKLEMSLSDEKEIELVIEPIPERFNEKINQEDYVLSLEVIYGPAIPIHIQAIVTIPFVQVSVDRLNFGIVKCGNVKILGFILQNGGHVPAKWDISMHIQNKVKKNTSNPCLCGEEDIDEDTFVLNKFRGTLNPKQEEIIELTYEPQFEGHHQCFLTISVAQNKEKLRVNVEGYGFQPYLYFTERIINFRSVLPYSQDNEIIFTVQNPCDIPTEFYLKDLDSQYKEEERLLNLLFQCNSMSKQFIPLRTPGSKIPPETFSFLKKLFQGMFSPVCTEYSEEEIEGKVEEAKSKKQLNQSSLMSNIFEYSITNPIMQYYASYTDVLGTDNPLEALQQKGYWKTIDDLMDFLTGSDTHCPILDNKKSRSGSADLSPEKQGFHVVFHGAPGSDCRYFANKAGTKIGLTVLNIDDEIFQAAACNDLPLASTIKNFINSTYDKYMIQMSMAPTGSVPSFDIIDDALDPDEELKQKAKILMELASQCIKSLAKSKSAKKLDKKKDSKAGTDRTPSAKSSVVAPSIKNQINDPTLKPNIFGDISFDIFVEILKQRFNKPDCQFGFIIDSLDSIFLPSKSAAVTCVLNAIGNFSTLYCIILHNTYNKMKEIEAQKKEKKDAELAEEHKRKISLFQENSLDELSGLTEEEILDLQQEILENRRSHFRETLEARKAKFDSLKQKKLGFKSSKAGRERTSKSQITKSEVGGVSTDKTKKSTGPDISEQSIKSSKKKLMSTGVLLSEDEAEFVRERELDAFEKDFHEISLILENWDVKNIVPVEVEKKVSVAAQRQKSVKRMRPSSGLALTSTSSCRNTDEVTIPEEANNKSSCGLPLWVVDVSDPEKNSIITAIQILSQLPEVKAMQESIELQGTKKIPEPKTLSVLLKTKRQEQQITFDIFQISPIFLTGNIRFEKDNVSEEALEVDPSINRLSKSKKENKSRTLSSKRDMSFCSEDDDKLDARWILIPGGQMRFKIQFKPRSVGEYREVYTFGQLDFNVNYQVVCVGLCDLPRINMDPTIMFQKVLPERVENHIVHCSYIMNENIFDFGPIIAMKTRDKRLLKPSTLFHISNCSTLVVDISFSLLENSPEKIFWMDNSSVRIEPGCSQNLSVYSYPTYSGVIMDTIVCSIKDNPVIETIKIMTEGVKAEFDVEPKKLTFEHILMYRVEKQSITMMNKCLIPLLWKFAGTEALEEDFKISATIGFLKPLQESTVEFTFISQKVQPVLQKPLKIDVYDEEARGDPLITEIITISSETIDANLDILFDTNEEYLNFGIIKMGYDTEKSMVLLNKGNYDLSYRLEMDPKTLQRFPILQTMITVDPISGQIPCGNKSCIVKIVCSPVTETDFVEIPLLKLYLHQNDDLIAIIPINFSLTTSYSRYVVIPCPDITFVPQLVGVKSTLQFTIQNSGFTLFTYSLKRLTFDEIDYSVQETIDKRQTSLTSRSKSLASVTTGKTGRASKKIEPMDAIFANAFIIYPANGSVNPGESAPITVEFGSEVEGQFVEDIGLLISDVSPTDQTCPVIHFYGTTCIPTIDFSDVDKMFQGITIYNNYEDINSTPEDDREFIYIKDLTMLLFRGVCVSSQSTASITLSNPGLLTCDVNASLVVSKSSKNQEPAFQIEPPKLSIKPQCCEKINILFTPKSLEVSKEVLELTVILPSNQKGAKCRINLQGESEIPEIKLISPFFDPCEEYGTLEFQPSLLHLPRSIKLEFQNVGSITCQVHVTLEENEGNSFRLNPDFNTVQLLQYFPEEDAIFDSTTVVLSPQKTAIFDVYFLPTEVGKCCGKLAIEVEKNPFLKYSIILSGNGFVNDITLVGNELQIYQDFNSPSSDFETPVVYDLNFQYCFVNKVKKQSFLVKNLSDSLYKYEWSKHENLDFSPYVGHIQPHQTRRITVTFKSPIPLVLEKVPINLTVSKIIITYPKKSLINIAWDDTMSAVQWIPEGDQSTKTDSEDYDTARVPTQSEIPTFHTKHLESIAEPENYIIDGTTKSITLLISAVVGYTQLSCTESRIIFKDTIIFQNNKQEFVLTNTGPVPVHYQWIFENASQFEPLYKFSGSPSQMGYSPSLAKFMIKKLMASRVESIIWKHTTEGDDSKIVGGGSAKNYLDKNNSEPSSYDKLDPFSIEPEYGNLNLGESVTCRVTFSPQKVSEYSTTLCCKSPNINPQHEELRVTLLGRSITPACHFDIEDSDYLSAKRRDITRPGPVGYGPCMPLDNETKVLEIKAVGVGLPVTITFDLINPTETNYHFKWKNMDAVQANIHIAFICNTLEGYLEKDSSCQSSFTFFCPSVGTHESFWNFFIPELNMTIPFLIVGHVSLPNVCFSSNHLKIGPTFPGTKTIKSVALINKDDVVLNFKFDTCSLLSRNMERLKVTPLEGIVDKNSETLIWIKFIPKLPGNAIFSLKCIISKLETPLYLNVFSTCYTANPIIYYEDLSKNKAELKWDEVNMIDLGESIPKIPTKIILTLSNCGKFAFSFCWCFEQEIYEKKKLKLNFSDKKGHVKPYSKTSCVISLTVQTKEDFMNLPLSLQISHGPTYNIILSTVSAFPDYSLSFTEYNFGLCFIDDSAKCTNSTQLYFTNNEDKQMLIDCLYVNKLHLNVNIDEPVVEPSSTNSINITFSPLESIKYKEILTFAINGTHKFKVIIYGEGAVLKVELLNAHDRHINFGALQPFSSISKTVTLINRSSVAVKATITFENVSNDNEQLTAHFSESYTSISDILQISPRGTFYIDEGKKIKLRIKFSPSERIKLFQKMVLIKVMDKTEPLCIVKGSCVGPEFSFNRNYVAFGTLNEKCKSEMKLILSNTGDIGSTYSWCPENQDENFTITPIKGYSAPGTENIFSVIFHPIKTQKYIRSQFICDLVNYNQLSVILTGSCVPLPPPTDTVYFSTNVRTQDKKSISITNSSNKMWELLPKISGEFFSGSEIFAVDANSTKAYDIKYYPLVMTDGDNHLGSILIEIPDGQPIIYDLVGTSDQPLAISKISVDIQCKSLYTQSLIISNWLARTQRFHVENTLTKQDKSDPLYELSGNEFIDIAGNSDFNYLWKIYTYKDGILGFRVKFINQTTEEYQFHEITLSIGKCSPLETIKISSCVRKSAFHEILLKNPLPVNTSFSITCSAPFIKFPPLISLNGLSTGPLSIEYFPLLPGETTGILEANSNDLGAYPYELVLCSTTGGPENSIKMEAFLGTSVIKEASFRNFAKMKTEFLCSVDNADFIIEKSVTVSGDQKGSVNICFEPNNIGNSEGTLTISSATAGEYVFPLIGRSRPPRPQGPFIVKPGGSINIPFKNVFREKKVFVITANRTFFTLKIDTVEMEAKKEMSIAVTLSKLQVLDQQNITLPINGKVTVVCNDSSLPFAKWTFYLQAIYDVKKTK